MSINQPFKTPKAHSDFLKVLQSHDELKLLTDPELLKYYVDLKEGKASIEWLETQRSNSAANNRRLGEINSEIALIEGMLSGRKLNFGE